MNEVRRILADLFITPEITFPALDSKIKAYLILYILPLIIFVCLMASAVFYGYTLLVVVTPIAFTLLYAVSMSHSYKNFRSPRKLKIASEEVLPEVLIDYFKKQYPSASVPMMLSKDRKHWVAYGHINKNRMARAMTFVEYHLMDPPPRLTDFFINHADQIKHQYLIIEDPRTELFRITDNPTKNSVYYPVTVFDKEEASDSPH